MARKSWREISAKNRTDPECVARVEAGARAMLVTSALTELREQLGLTQADLAAEMGVSQARVSQIEHQQDLNLSTLEQVVRAMGGQLGIRIGIAGQTIELLEPSFQTEIAVRQPVGLREPIIHRRPGVGQRVTRVELASGLDNYSQSFIRRSPQLTFSINAPSDDLPIAMVHQRLEEDLEQTLTLR